MLSCNCANCSEIMAAILHFTGEAILPILETAFPATENNTRTTIVKIAPTEANIMAISAVLDTALRTIK